MKIAFSQSGILWLGRENLISIGKLQDLSSVVHIMGLRRHKFVRLRADERRHWAISAPVHKELFYVFFWRGDM